MSVQHDFQRGDIVMFDRNLSHSWGVVRDTDRQQVPNVDWLVSGDTWFQQGGCLAMDIKLYDGDEAAVPDEVLTHSMLLALGAA